MLLQNHKTGQKCVYRFPFIIKQIHLYVDDHHGPHHEAVMVRELCITIVENRFIVFTAEEMCHLVEYLCTI